MTQLPALLQRGVERRESKRAIIILFSRAQPTVLCKKELKIQMEMKMKMMIKMMMMIQIQMQMEIKEKAK